MWRPCEAYQCAYLWYPSDVKRADYWVVFIPSAIYKQPSSWFDQLMCWKINCTTWSLKCIYFVNSSLLKAIFWVDLLFQKCLFLIWLFEMYQYLLEVPGWITGQVKPKIFKLVFEAPSLCMWSDISVRRYCKVVMIPYLLQASTVLIWPEMCWKGR